MIIVQIGSNRGSDDLTDIVLKNKIEKLVIIEPMAMHNDAISKCYSEIKNKAIENLAISCSEDSEIEFFYHLSDGPGYEVSSTDKNHVLKHGYNSDGLVSVRVPSMTINNLFRKHSIINLDILFIDAEGLDDSIIRSIDFSEFKIKKIYFENLHLKTDIRSFLVEKGYNITDGFGLNGWTSLAYV